jgi:hypothetical protein
MRRAKSAADTARDAAFVECTVVEVRTGYQINAAKARSASYLPNVLARWPTARITPAHPERHRRARHHRRDGHDVRDIMNSFIGISKPHPTNLAVLCRCFRLPYHPTGKVSHVLVPSLELS